MQVNDTPRQARRTGMTASISEQIAKKRAAAEKKAAEAAAIKKEP